LLAGQGAQIDTTTAGGRLVFGIFARHLVRLPVLGPRGAHFQSRKNPQVSVVS